MKRNTPIKAKRDTPRRTGEPLPRVGKVDGNFRCPALLKLAAKAPHCMRRSCRISNAGQVVAAHSNRQSEGKGRGIKSHDIPAFLCGRCHDEIDGRSGYLTQDEREVEFDEARFETILWALRAGHLKVIP